MASVKNITELPVAKSVDGLNLIVNDNGSAKQIPAREVGSQADWTETDEASPAFVKNKPGREIVYERNFSADFDVYYISENVNDDLSWLFDSSGTTDFEVVTTLYGKREDEVNGSGRTVVDNSVTTSMTLLNKEFYTKDGSGSQLFCYMLGQSGYCDQNADIGYYCSGVSLSACDKMHIDDFGDLTPVSIGGFFDIFVDAGGPLKSVKIYKITR